MQTRPASAGKLQNAIECGVRQAGGFAGDLGGDEFLVNRELAEPGEDAGKRPEDPPDVIDRIHVGRIEAGNHRIEARLLFLRQRAVHAGDVRVGERVVIKRGIGLQVIGRREFPGVRKRPLLLEGNAEQRRSTDPVAHDLQELLAADSLLDVVRQMKVGIIELRGVGLALRRNEHDPSRDRAAGERRSQSDETGRLRRKAGGDGHTGISAQQVPSKNQRRGQAKLFKRKERVSADSSRKPPQNSDRVGTAKCVASRKEWSLAAWLTHGRSAHALRNLGREPPTMDEMRVSSDMPGRPVRCPPLRDSRNSAVLQRFASPESGTNLEQVLLYGMAWCE